MNNKGMTLVEVLVTFSLLMVIVVGMFNLILDVKGDLDSKQTTKGFVEFSDFLNHDIHMDLLKHKPIAIAVRKVDKDSNTGNDGKWRCSYSKYYSVSDPSGECKINQETKIFAIDASLSTPDGEISLTDNTKNLTNVCHGFYPCAVYAYYEADKNNNPTIKYQVIAISKDSKSQTGLGIQYGNTFEAIPNANYVNILKSIPSISFENGFFVIDYPLYATGDPINYGFKVAYPFN